MEQNTQSFMIEGANPSMVWCNIADYIGMLSKSMMKTYKQRQRTNKQITWDELDELNDKLRSDLDVIICGHKNVQNENKQRTSENRTMAKKQVIRLNENQLREMVEESVNMLLKESFGSRLGQAFRSAKAGYKAEKSADDYFANKPVTTAQSSLRSLIQYATYMQNNFDKVDLQKYANTLANIAQNLKTECEPFNRHKTMVRFPENPNKPGPLPYK